MLAWQGRPSNRKRFSRLAATHNRQPEPFAAAHLVVQADFVRLHMPLLLGVFVQHRNGGRRAPVCKAGGRQNKSPLAQHTCSHPSMRMHLHGAARHTWHTHTRPSSCCNACRRWAGVQSCCTASSWQNTEIEHILAKCITRSSPRKAMSTTFSSSSRMLKASPSPRPRSSRGMTCAA